MSFRLGISSGLLLAIKDRKINKLNHLALLKVVLAYILSLVR